MIKSPHNYLEVYACIFLDFSKEVRIVTYIFITLEITEEQLDIQQLGLGHTYSRSRVKHDVGRHDKSIIQAIALVDLVRDNTVL